MINDKDFAIASVLVWVSGSVWTTFVLPYLGVILALIGLILNYYFKSRHDKRASEKHAAEMKILQEKSKNLDS